MMQRIEYPLDIGPSSLVLYPTKRKKKNRTLQEERTGAGARQDGVTDEGGADIVGEAQGGGGSGQTLNRADVLARRSRQVEVPAESRADVSAHGFWKRGTIAMFVIRIANLNAGTYLRMTPEKALAKAEK